MKSEEQMKGKRERAKGKNKSGVRSKEEKGLRTMGYGLSAES